uniref:Uncharacterized protein n=1 Tax=uncultured Armatimonadetes bacterium TaxID=157466 RepID=A0A6J4I9L4_9BACT|nr:hypothetical protein AVDCRST_MAG63-1684 [uncultured Armatimonadetes bacterium]
MTTTRADFLPLHGALPLTGMAGTATSWSYEPEFLRQLVAGVPSLLGVQDPILA